MPAARFAGRRRRSSLAHPHLKASKYRTPAKNVTFAPNVTPATYQSTGPDDLALEDIIQPVLFPPSDVPRGPPKKKQPKNRRRSQGYIPRPPNAFMLFRADFVKQKHVPGSIEPSHTNLSKIIGITWKSLPEEEKQVWMNLARKEAAEHKAMYPNYKYQPRPPKKKRKVKTDDFDFESEQHCEDVRQLLLEGLKGAELEHALAELRRARSASATPSSSAGSAFAPTRAPSMPPVSETSSSYAAGSPYMSTSSSSTATGLSLGPAPVYMRRPSSVPLPGVFPYPTGLPPISFPRMPSIDFSGGNGGHAMQHPMSLPRRPSSAQAAIFRTWAAPFDVPPTTHQQQHQHQQQYQHQQHYAASPIPLPMLDAVDVFGSTFNGVGVGVGDDASAFPGEMTWSFDGGASHGAGGGVLPTGPDGMPLAPHEITISPLDAMPHNSTASTQAQTQMEWLGSMTFGESSYADAASQSQYTDASQQPYADASQPSYTDSSQPPAEITPPELSVPLPLFAPKPHRPYDWDSSEHAAISASSLSQPSAQQQLQQQQHHQQALGKNELEQQQQDVLAYGHGHAHDDPFAAYMDLNAAYGQQDAYNPAAFGAVDFSSAVAVAPEALYPVNVDPGAVF